MNDEPIDLETSEQAKTLLNAEDAFGEQLVARVLRVTWDGENDDSFLWSINDCTRCGKQMFLGDEGFIWGRPMNDEPHCEYVTMTCFCSETCVTDEVIDWSRRHGKDVVVGYYGS